MLSLKSLHAVALLGSLSLAGCSETNTPLEVETGGDLSLSGARSAMVDASAAAAYLDEVNAKLASDGVNVRVAYAEYVTGGPTADAAGQIVFANDRQKRLTAQWVPFLGNPIRDRDATVNHAIFLPFASTSDGIDGEPEIDASFDTWENLACSNLDIVKHPGLPANVFPSAILDLPGFVNNFYLADINTIGFLPGFIFEAVLGPGAADGVLGVTFTFIWVDENDDPTDLDNNGYDDVAIKEVWYNDEFQWTDTGLPASAIDIQTVAFHENGHTLGLGHYGRVFGTISNLTLHIAPRAAMNAFIFDVLREPLGTDTAGYCGIYGQWPN